MFFIILYNSKHYVLCDEKLDILPFILNKLKMKIIKKRTQTREDHTEFVVGTETEKRVDCCARNGNFIEEKKFFPAFSLTISKITLKWFPPSTLLHFFLVFIITRCGAGSLLKQNKKFLN